MPSSRREDPHRRRRHPHHMDLLLKGRPTAQAIQGTSLRSSPAPHTIQNTSVPIVGVDSQVSLQSTAARSTSPVLELSASTRVRRDQTLSASGHIRFNFGDLSDSELFYNTFGLPRSNS